MLERGVDVGPSAVCANGIGGSAGIFCGNVVLGSARAPGKRYWPDA